MHPQTLDTELGREIGQDQDNLRAVLAEGLATLLHRTGRPHACLIWAPDYIGEGFIALRVG
jgi:hypothetical protein